eukprot:24352-Prorocentrum_minimum.AAC.1
MRSLRSTFCSMSEVPPMSVKTTVRGKKVQNASYQRCEHPGFPARNMRERGGGGEGARKG